jgi:hypothetical protein
VARETMSSLWLCAVGVDGHRPLAAKLANATHPVSVDAQVYPLRGQIVRVRQVGCDRTVRTATRFFFFFLRVMCVLCVCVVCVVFTWLLPLLRVLDQVSDEEGPNSVGYFISRQHDIILGGTAIKGTRLFTVTVRGDGGDF